MYMHQGPSGPDQGQNAGPGMSPSPITVPHSQSASGGGQYPFAFDPSYHGEAAAAGAAAGPSGSSYEYSYSRTQHDSSLPLNTGTEQPAFQSDLSGQGQGQGIGDPGSGWYGAEAGETSTSLSHERGTTRDSARWPMNQQTQSYDMSGSSSSSYHPFGSSGESPAASGWDNGKAMTHSQWPDEYAGPTSTERELVGLRMTLSDLVESISPYASSPTNPRPPPPSSYLQARFIRLASTVQTTLSNLKPHLHSTLHPQFTLAPPYHRHKRSKTRHGAVSPGVGEANLSAAEREMEVIRKRRDMLIARAAQVQASSHPAAVHHSQLPANWPANHGEIYQNGAGVHSTNGPTPTNNGSFPPLSDGNAGTGTSLNSSRRSTMTLENFDASLARFSLDPTKIGQNMNMNTNSNGNGLGTGTGASTGAGTGAGLFGGMVMEDKKQSAEDGRCHGCGVSVTAEWRRGPDGPRSLCNACGLHYAKLTRRRAQEEANAAAKAKVEAGTDANSFPPSIHTFSVDGIL